MFDIFYIYMYRANNYSELERKDENCNFSNHRSSQKEPMLM